MRFIITGPFHGESQSLWYIYDDDKDEIIGSINQKGEIAANKPLNYKRNPSLDQALNEGKGVYIP